MEVSWHDVALKLLFTFATWSCPDILEVGSERKQRWKHPSVAVKVLGIPDINKMFGHAPLETTTRGFVPSENLTWRLVIKSPAERRQRAQAALVSQPFTRSLLWKCPPAVKLRWKIKDTPTSIKTFFFFLNHGGLSNNCLHHFFLFCHCGIRLSFWLTPPTTSTPVPRHKWHTETIKTPKIHPSPNHWSAARFISRAPRQPSIGVYHWTGPAKVQWGIFNQEPSVFFQLSLTALEIISRHSRGGGGYAQGWAESSQDRV